MMKNEDRECKKIGLWEREGRREKSQGLKEWPIHVQCKPTRELSRGYNLRCNALN